MISDRAQTVVLLVNLGTPHAPTALGVLRFLREFLWDPRVIRVPRILWWLILWGLVLPLRSFRVARLYRKIWLPEGSPLQVFTARLAKALELHLQSRLAYPIPVLYGMTYGKNNLRSVLKAIQAWDVAHLIIIPLFPQYSATTTAAVFDKLAVHFKHLSYIPAVTFINEYSRELIYCQAIADSILEFWKSESPTERLLFSFHGIPVRYEQTGDPYPERCRIMAHTVAELLRIPKETWAAGFQSRFGFDAWVQPDSAQQLVQWAVSGVQSVTVISPSFSVDCLETLEELNIQNRQKFFEAGGKVFHYIPALNDSRAHLNVLTALVEKNF